jgi:hypothetical protein
MEEPLLQPTSERCFNNHSVWLLLLLLLAVGLEFFVRGPIRFLEASRGWTDISEVYLPSKAWVKGLNPYSPDVFVEQSLQATGNSPSKNDIRSYSPYPLTSFVVIAPISVLPWWCARFIWGATLSLAVGAMIWSLASMGRLTSLFHISLLAAFTLALAPLQTGIAVGNVSILAIALCCIAAFGASANWDLMAGISLALGACLKPQLGICFLIYYVLQKRFRIVFIACGLGIAVFVIGVCRLELSGISWIGDFFRNARRFASECLTADFTQQNPTRFTLLNLQVLCYSLSQNVLFARIMAPVATFILLAVWLGFSLSKRYRPSELATLSTMAILSLLPVYHRNYDATLLVFPLCFILSKSKEQLCKLEYVMLVLMLPFAIPGPALLQKLAEDGRIPPHIVQGWWWNGMVMPHEIWALLFISILLLYNMIAKSTETLRMTNQHSHGKE